MKKKPLNPDPGPAILSLQASAGSGKTYALARRYIECILAEDITAEHDPVRSALAITFTNKAALEMKERILDLLKRMALGLDVEGMPALPVDKKRAAGRASDAVDHIIRNYNFFHVQTIDSFINALLMRCALEVGLSSSFALEDRFADYIEYSLDSLLDAMAEDDGVSGVIDDFLEQYLFVENKEGWFPRRDMVSLLASLFLVNNTYGGSFIKEKKGARDIIAKKRRTLDLGRRLLGSLPEGTKQMFVTALEKFVNENEDTFDIGSLSTFFHHADFPLKKGFDLPPSTGKLWARIRANIRTVAEWEAFSRFNCYLDMYESVYRLF
ncbi:MAG: UvrD-helicase domain-containing protein, partial [Candidatus Omnitrophica bacterium]|nr:UvrD-helicase domain-containing protein [Candidatus Omnitrophota bacterium]